MIEQLTCYYSEHGKDPTFTIQYESGRTRQHVKLCELPHSVVDFIAFRTPQKTNNENVVVYKK